MKNKTRYYKLFFTEREGERERSESTLLVVQSDQQLDKVVAQTLLNRWGDDSNSVEIGPNWISLCYGEVSISREYTRELTKREFKILSEYSS